jgi:hypothetical protein
MDVLSQPLNPSRPEQIGEFFYVVHPLDDVPEEKIKSDHLPPLEMTRSVRWSLFVLRAYLILMTLLLAYHVIDLAGHILKSK